MPRGLEYNALPESDAPGRIWKNLYAYRSAIAHGVDVDFTKTFHALGDATAARKFLEGACRRILKHALSEPALYRDLRAV